jgi:hypothetical protein
MSYSDPPKGYAEIARVLLLSLSHGEGILARFEDATDTYVGGFVLLQ